MSTIDTKISISPTRLSQLEAHLDDGGKFSHDNAVELLGELATAKRVITEWERDMKGTLATLETVKAENARLAEVLKKILKHPTGYSEPYMREERQEAETVISKHSAPPHRKQKPQRRRIEDENRDARNCS